MDVDGDERYQLYRFNLSDNTYHQFTDDTSKNYPGYFDKRGNIFSYTSMKPEGGETCIYTIDQETPESKRMIYHAKGSWGLGHWSPAANQILVWEGISYEENRLHTLDVETGEMKDLFPKETEKVVYFSALWSKDGKSIYFVSNKDCEFMTLRHLDLLTGNVKLLTAHIPWDIEECISSPDGKYLALRINEDAVSVLYMFDTETEKTWKVENLPDGLVEAIFFHPQRNEIGFTNISPKGMTSVYSYNVDTNKVTKWTDSDSEDTDKPPPPRIIRYPTFDKVDGKPRMIPAVIFDAVGSFEGPRPVMIDLHGGVGYVGQSRPISSPHYDLLRKEGVTIIAPNFRGSAGYGKTFIALDNGYLRDGGVKDIGALLDWISTQPNLNSQRIGVSGGSYGGYMTLASLTHYSDKLRCGIDLCGIANFATWLKNTEDYALNFYRTEFGDERDPKMRSFLESISPVNQADKIKAPLLVIQGRNDPRVPVSESRQIVDKVRAQGGEVWYIEAANEGHGISKPQNGFYVGAAAFAFLRKHLLEKD
jgi:dipeptidyl aminopeptidase/acylaminoacyl peptidase